MDNDQYGLEYLLEAKKMSIGSIVLIRRMRMSFSNEPSESDISSCLAVSKRLNIEGVAPQK